MKKIIILLLFITLLTGCNKKNNDNLIKETQAIVEKEIKKMNIYNKKTVKESINYILDNYDKKINKDYIYHSTLLYNIANNKYVKNNPISDLANNIYNYINGKIEKIELKSLVKKIKKDKNKLIDDFYTNYERNININKYLTDTKTKLITELQTKEAVTTKKVKKAIDYLLLNYKNPFKNTESLEKSIYYSMYLDTIATKYKVENDLIKYARFTKKYIQEYNEKYIKEIEKIKDNVEKNKDQLVEEIINKSKK